MNHMAIEGSHSSVNIHQNEMFYSSSLPTPLLTLSVLNTDSTTNTHYQCWILTPLLTLSVRLKVGSGDLSDRLSLELRNLFVMHVIMLKFLCVFWHIWSFFRFGNVWKHKTRKKKKKKSPPHFVNLGHVLGAPRFGRVRRARTEVQFIDDGAAVGPGVIEWPGLEWGRVKWSEWSV